MSWFAMDRKRLHKAESSSRWVETLSAMRCRAMEGLPKDVAPDPCLPAVDSSGQELVRECPHCGTGVQLEVDFCPICGSKLGAPDGGLVGLFDGMEFRDKDREIDCPRCGEHVVLEEGTCPACNEDVTGDDRDAPTLDPVVHEPNIVLMRLDVESGEVSYLQRGKDGASWDQVTVPVSDGHRRER